MDRLMHREKSLQLLAACVLLASVIMFLIRYRYFFHDDEMISLRYARNFLEGKGLVWNDGEKVEGYTNFLHLVLSAGIIRLTGDYLLAPRILNFLFLILMIVAGYYISRHKNIAPRHRQVAPFVFLLVVASHPSFYIWSYGGLETVMYSSLLFLAVGTLLVSGNSTRSGILTGLLFAMASMTRPEGNLVFFITCLYLLALALQNKQWAKPVVAVITYGLLFGLYFLWRYNYYGQLLPNTFYAKTNLTSGKFLAGIIYTLRFYISIIFTAGLLLFLFWKTARRITKADSKIYYLLALLVFYMLAIFSYGGDHMLAMRFCVPLLPLLGLLLILLLEKVQAPLRNLATVVLVVNAVYLWVLPMNSFRLTKSTDDAAAVGYSVGRYLRDNMPDDFVIATNSAGGIPFVASNNQFIDMLGLCDSTIAKRKIDKATAARFSWPGHEKGDGNYVLSRNPDIIILGPAHGNDASEPDLLSDAEIVSSPLFSKYEKKTVWIDPQSYQSGSLVRFRNPKINSRFLFTWYQVKPEQQELSHAGRTNVYRAE